MVYIYNHGATRNRERLQLLANILQSTSQRQHFIKFPKELQKLSVTQGCSDHLFTVFNSRLLFSSSHLIPAS